MSPMRAAPTPDAHKHFQFSSAGRDPAEAFAAYADLYAHGSDVSPGPGPFHAEMQAWRMDGFLLFDRQVSGVIHSREARVAIDGFDHIVLYAILRGEVIGSPASGFDVARVGDIAMVDTRRAMRTEIRDAHFLTVSIARHRIEAIVPDAAGLHGRVIPAPATLVLIDYLNSLIRRASMISADAMPAYSQIMIELLGAALTSSNQRGFDGRRQDFLRRQTVEQFINDRLGDQNLSGALVSQETGISRSSLYRLIEGHGGVNRLIRTRRLEGLRVAMEEGSSESLSALALRYGFSSESHMSRLFADAYGQPPGAYRQHIRTIDGASAGAAQRRWRGWMSELI